MDGSYEGFIEALGLWQRQDQPNPAIGSFGNTV
jgi:hypothetical protein